MVFSTATASQNKVNVVLARSTTAWRTTVTSYIQLHHCLHRLHVPAVTSSCQATQLLRNGSELVSRCSDFLLLSLQCGCCLRLLLLQLQQAVYALQGLKLWSSKPAKLVPGAAEAQP
jgi:hypothetical protein